MSPLSWKWPNVLPCRLSAIASALDTCGRFLLITVGDSSGESGPGISAEGESPPTARGLTSEDWRSAGSGVEGSISMQHRGRDWVTRRVESAYDRREIASLRF